GSTAHRHPERGGRAARHLPRPRARLGQRRHLQPRPQAAVPLRARPELHPLRVQRPRDLRRADRRRRHGRDLRDRLQHRGPRRPGGRPALPQRPRGLRGAAAQAPGGLHQGGPRRRGERARELPPPRRPHLLHRSRPAAHRRARRVPGAPGRLERGRHPRGLLPHHRRGAGHRAGPRGAGDARGRLPARAAARAAGHGDGGRIGRERAVTSAHPSRTAPGDRVETLRLRILDEHGQARASQEARLTQVSHDFGFGCSAFELRPQEPDEHTRLWLDLFNMATLPFYWRWFETIPGQPDTDRLLRLAEGLRGHGVRLKGHPLLWHTLAPTWLLEKDDAEVERLIRERITREATDFAGLIEQWDAINETVILPVFEAEENAVTRLAQARGRMEVVRLAFETARAADPSARLVLNDFDLSSAFEDAIEECLEAGLEIDAIGLQTHMHQGYRGEEQITEV